MRKIQKVSVQQGGSGHQKDIITSNEKYLENPDIEEYLKQEEEIENELEREELENRTLLPKKSHLEAALDTVQENFKELSMKNFNKFCVLRSPSQ